LVQLTAFSTETPTEIAFFVASTSPALAVRRLEIALWTCVTSAWRVTTTGVVIFAAELSASNACTKHRIWFCKVEEPAGRVLVPVVNSDLARTTIDAPLLGDTNPSWYVIGRSASDHPDVAKANGVDSSVPEVGSTVRPPGTGGPLVVTTTDSAEVPHVRVNTSDARAGSALAPSTR
jgi:hypothetical protein